MNKKSGLLLGLGLFFLFYLFYLKSLSPTLYWDDSGELIASASTMGVPHPTGYPLYAICGRIFSLLPLGSLAWRINLLSLTNAAGAVYLVWLLAQYFCLEKAPFLAVVPAAFFGFSPVLWHSGTIAEVYALNIFLLSLTFVFFFLSPTRQTIKLFVFLAGLSMGNHLSLVLLLPACLFFFWGLKRPKFLLTSGLLILLIAGGTYLYLPLRAVTAPPLNWGKPVNWSNFVWLVSGREFTQRMFKGGITALLGRLGKTAVLFFFQFQVGLIIGLVGMLLVFLRRRRTGIFLHLAFWGVTIFTLGYDITPLSDWHAYFLPAWLIGSLFIAYTLAYFSPGKAATVALLAVPLLTSVATPCFNLHREEFAPYRDATFILGQLPPDSLVINHDSTRTFSLLYLTAVEKRKTAVTLLYAPLLKYDWFLRELNDKGVALPGIERRQTSYRSYVTKLALLNVQERPVYGFDWWTEFFSGLIPHGPLFQIKPAGFSPSLIPQSERMEKAYFDYVVRTAQKISPPLKEVLTEHNAALGTFLQRHQLFEAAIPYYFRSLDYNPQQAVLSNNLAICLEMSGQLQKAVAQYQKTIELRPDFTSPYGNLGRLYYKQGERNKAISILTQALEYNPRGEFSNDLRDDLFKIKQGEPLN